MNTQKEVKNISECPEFVTGNRYIPNKQEKSVKKCVSANFNHIPVPYNPVKEKILEFIDILCKREYSYEQITKIMGLKNKGQVFLIHKRKWFPSKQARVRTRIWYEKLKKEVENGSN